MSVSVDVIKELAIGAMTQKHGEALGKAYGFLMFGGFGLPGLVDGATLAARGNAEAANELTGDLAVSLVSDVAKAGLAKILEARAAGVLEAAGVTAEAVATMSMLVVNVTLDSTAVAPGTLPPAPVAASGVPSGHGGIVGGLDGGRPGGSDGGGELHGTGSGVGLPVVGGPHRGAGDGGRPGGVPGGGDGSEEGPGHDPASGQIDGSCGPTVDDCMIVIAPR